MANEQYDLAISYSYVDRAIAEQLEKALTSRERRLKVWCDARTEPGGDITPRVAEALRRSKAVLVLWSKDGAASSWVAKEATYAHCAGKAIGVSLADFSRITLPSRFRNMECLSGSKVLEDPAALIEALDRLSERERPARPERELIDISRLPTPASPFVGRYGEVAELMGAWTHGLPNIVAFVGEGGVGKTAIADAFVNEMARLGWGGAEAVFAFSFAGQGGGVHGPSASDQFFSDALRFFGVDPQFFDTVRSRAAKLSELLESRRTLLVLDGLEALQVPGGTQGAGCVHDDAMREFLLEVARDNRGLCIVTSRAPLADFANHGEAVVQQINLRGLPLPSAVEMLRDANLGYPEDALAALASAHCAIEGDDGLNAQATALLAAYLSSRFPGLREPPSDEEAKEAFDLSDDAVAAKIGEDAGAVLRMLRRFEILFEQLVEVGVPADGPRQPERQLMLLRIMGLFDGPAPWGAVKGVLKAPPIEGLTENLDDVSEELWSSTVQALREAGLLRPSDDDSAYADELPDEHMLDAHPLVRAYFSERLAESSPEALRQAHSRLYDYYRFIGLPEEFRAPVPYGVLALGAAYPDKPFARALEMHATRGLTEETVQNWPLALHSAPPAELKAAIALIDEDGWDDALAAFRPDKEHGVFQLFRAIAHGCAAGRHEECFNEVYGPRVARGGAHFATAELGLYGLHLAALAHFFAEPFAKPAEGLSPPRQAALFNIAAFTLRALGRLTASVAPMRGAARLLKEMGDWEGAAAAYSALAELLMVLGRLNDGDDGEGALSAAEEGVRLADRSGELFESTVKRAVYADVLHHAGRWSEAARLFVEAESLQRERQPDLPLLYSISGARWADLKIAQGRGAEVWARAMYCEGRRAANPDMSVLDLGVETLAAGRAAHLAVRENRAPYVRAAAMLDRAIDGLRAAGRGEHIPLGYLARAACRREAGDPLGARNDFEAARAIVVRGEMGLYEVDLSIEEAWQAFYADDHAVAEREIAYLEDAISRTGYLRRAPDLALLLAAHRLIAGDKEAAKPHLDALVEAMRAHNLWCFAPEFDWLVETYELSDLEAVRDELRAARERFDAQENAAFDKVRRRADGLDDDIVDARLADPAFRARLTNAVKRTSDLELERLSLHDQREYARAYITGVERPQQNMAQKPVDPASIPDEMVEEMLADEKFCAMVDHLHEQMGKPELAEMSEVARREAARAVIAATIVVKRQEDARPALGAEESATAAEPPREAEEAGAQSKDDAAAPSDEEVAAQPSAEGDASAFAGASVEKASDVREQKDLSPEVAKDEPLEEGAAVECAAEDGSETAAPKETASTVASLDSFSADRRASTPTGFGERSILGRGLGGLFKRKPRKAPEDERSGAA